MTQAGVMLRHHVFVRAVARGLRLRCGVRAGAKVVVAVSGGADSVALLRAMAMLAPRRRWGLQLMAAHVQHHLRPPEEAEGDAAFVADLAGQLGLPFMRADIEISGGGNVEAAARRERYRAIDEMAAEAGFDFIATAHHGDDQLETLLMRMLRGASVKGMRGIAWRRRLKSGRRVVRPMLECSREQARDFLRSLDQAWCEDRTNRDASKLRARLRAQVLPVLSDIRSDVPRKATQLADHFGELAVLLERAVDEAEQLVRVEDGASVMDRNEARELPGAVLTGLLRRLLTDAGVGADQLGERALGPVVRAISDRRGGERRFELGGGAVVVVTRGAVRL